MTVTLHDTNRLDFAKDGKRSTRIEVPARGSGQSVWLPITIVRKGPGPVVLFTGGNHGDEYEGPVALMKLARQLTTRELLCGTVVIMPIIHPAAFAAGTRQSPIDGKNLNRVFPGKANGTPTERIAHAITTTVLPNVDAVFDLHAGGRQAVLVPSVWIHELPDDELMDRTVSAMKAFRAPVGMVIKEYDSEGMIDTTVERMGKLFFCCELGGAGMLSPETVRIAEVGIRNVLKHFGILGGSLETALWRNRLQTDVLELLSFDRYLHAAGTGVFEPFVDLEDAVEKGQPVGQIHSFKSHNRAPLVCQAPADGMIYMRHAFGLISRGQVVVMVARKSPRWCTDLATES